jgi:hypothetical protein
MLKIVSPAGVWFLLLFFCLFPCGVMAADKPVVKYFAETDLLSIEADNHSLDMVLGQIALQTGMDISMSPLAERSISLSIQALPLEAALKKLVKVSHASHMLIYGQSAGMKLTPIGMKIFSQGSFANNELKPVVPVELEAITQVKRERRLQTTAVDIERPAGDIRDLAQQRWQERLSQMSDEKREKVELKMQQQTERQSAKEQKRAEKEEQRAKKKALLVDKRKAKEERLRAQNPAQYEQREQQRKANLERDKEIFYQYNPPK